MNAPRDRTVTGPSTSWETPQHLASWYAPGVSDGLGDRLLMFDNTNAPSWELLRFRPEFAAAPGFESALRERVAQLGQFRHPSFPSVRNVEDLGPRNGLALVSTYVEGRRLWEALERPRSAPAAMRLIRQLTPALAALQRHGEGLTHGVLTIDRVVLTPEGRFVIREHVLGSAIQRLGLSATRLWVDLGVVVSPAGGAVPRLDRRTDVLQLALIALALMLGRRIHAGEYPGKIEELLDQIARVAGRRAPLLFPPLRHWLERALLIKGRPFASAQDANDALGDWSDESQGEVADFELPAPAPPLENGKALQPTRAAAPPAPRPGPVRASSARVPVEATAARSVVQAAEAPRVRPAPAARIATGASSTGALDLFSAESARPAPAAATRPVRQPVPAPAPAPLSAPAPAAPRRSRGSVLPIDQSDPSLGLPAQAGDGSRSLRWAAGGAFLLAIGEAALIGYLVYVRPPAPSQPDTAILVESVQPGSDVLVDGRPVGVTPLQVKVDSRTLSIRVQGPETVSPPATAANQVVPADPESQRPARLKPNARAIDPPRVAATPPRSGAMRLTSAFELHVFEGDALLGSSRDGAIETTPGRHEFDLVNGDLGYRSRRVVDIKAGQTLSVEVVPTYGRVSINASPWADVWIDGNSVGQTPLAKLSVTLGEHEFIFRHPQLGERRQKAMVRAEGVTLVSANLGS